jgi:integrase
MRQLLTQLQDAGLSARRINLALLVLKMILQTAVRRRFVREDPTEHVRGLREPKTEVDPLDPDMVTAFLAACPPWWRSYFTVAFWTGARTNELAALHLAMSIPRAASSASGLDAIAARKARPRPPAVCGTSTCCRPWWRP